MTELQRTPGVTPFETLGHYRILERIGAGGLGDVYRGRDTRLGRTVAIKVPPDDLQSDPSRRDGLFRDANAALALSHPNIATLYEIGDEHGTAFLVFEFAPGETLKRVIAGQPMNPRRAVDLAAQIADALADAHASDIVHGHLGPDAVIVTPKGNAKILDFGFSRWTKNAESRIDGDGEREDIQALGRLLFEMLTGIPCVSAGSASASGLNPSLPDELRAMVSKSVADGDTYQSAAAMAAELRSVAAILDVRAASDAVRVVPARSRRPAGQTPWIVAAVLLAVAALAGAAWWLL